MAPWVLLAVPVVMNPEFEIPIMWSASPGIARQEAVREGKSLLVALDLQSDRFRRWSNMLSHPQVRNRLEPYVLLSLSTPEELSQLVPGIVPPKTSQLLFVSSEGIVLKRLAWSLPAEDFAHILGKVQSLAANTQPMTQTVAHRASDEPAAHVSPAEEAAMKGDTRLAGRLLANGRDADAWGALGDTFWAEGNREAADRAYRSAVRHARTPEEEFRWRFRSASSLFWMGKWEESEVAAKGLSRLGSLGLSRRTQAERLISRISMARPVRN